MSAMEIAGRRVGTGLPTFVIAEAGSNHNGSFDLAKRLIDVAAGTGADAVKFQTFRAKALYPRTAGSIDLDRVGEPIFDALAKLEMPYEWIRELAEYCSGKRILFLSTPFDEQSVDALDPYVPAFKIASYEISHIPLIRHIASKGKPIILSTATADLEDVREAVEVIREAGGDKRLILLQCTAEYPAPIDSLNLRAITTLRTEFAVPTGLSDHSRDPLIAPVAAVALGACVIEKHFTLSNLLPGPDHVFAIEPHELGQMIKAIRSVEVSLGDGQKRCQPSESKRAAFGRRSIFALQEIRVGEPFTRANIAVLRCGEHEPGIHPRYFEEILGKTAARTIEGGYPVPQEAVAAIAVKKD